MVFIAGWGEKGSTLGNSKSLQCLHCNNVGPHNVVERSKRVSVFFVPVVKWQFKYYLICPICSRGFELEGKEAALTVIAESFGGIRE